MDTELKKIDMELTNSKIGDTEQKVIRYFGDYFNGTKPQLGFLYQMNLFSRFSFTCFDLLPKFEEVEENKNCIRYKEACFLEQIEAHKMASKEENEKEKKLNELLKELRPEEVFSILISFALYADDEFFNKININWLSGKVEEFAIGTNERYLIISSQFLKEFSVDFFEFYNKMPAFFRCGVVKFEQIYERVKKELSLTISDELERDTLQFIRKFMEYDKETYTALLTNFDKPLLLVFKTLEAESLDMRELYTRMKEETYDEEDVINVLYRNGIRELSMVSLESVDIEALFKAMCACYEYEEYSIIKYCRFSMKNNVLYISNQDVRSTLWEMKDYIASECKSKLFENQGIKPFELEDYYHSFKSESRPNMTIRKYYMKEKN